MDAAVQLNTRVIIVKIKLYAHLLMKENVILVILQELSFKMIALAHAKVVTLVQIVNIPYVNKALEVIPVKMVELLQDTF